MIRLGSSLINVFCYVTPCSMVKCTYVTKGPVSSISVCSDNSQTRASSTFVSLNQNTQHHVSRESKYHSREKLKHR